MANQPSISSCQTTVTKEIPRCQVSEETTQSTNTITKNKVSEWQDFDQPTQFQTSINSSTNITVVQPITIQNTYTMTQPVLPIVPKIYLVQNPVVPLLNPNFRQFAAPFGQWPLNYPRAPLVLPPQQTLLNLQQSALFKQQQAALYEQQQAALYEQGYAQFEQTYAKYLDSQHGQKYGQGYSQYGQYRQYGQQFPAQNQQGQSQAQGPSYYTPAATTSCNTVVNTGNTSVPPPIPKTSVSPPTLKVLTPTVKTKQPPFSQCASQPVSQHIPRPPPASQEPAAQKPGTWEITEKILQNELATWETTEKLLHEARTKMMPPAKRPRIEEPGAGCTPPPSEQTGYKHLYIGNLPPGTRATTLRDLLAPFGKVTMCKVAASKGANAGIFAFVTIDCTTDGSAVVSHVNGLEFNGAVLTAKKLKNPPVMKTR